MLVTASWGGADVAVEVDAECRSVAALKRCLQEALPEVDVEAVRLEVCGRPLDDEGVLSLVDGSVIDVSATQAALAAAALREEGCAVDFNGFCDAACASDMLRCRLYLEAGVVWPSGGDNPLHIAAWHGYGELCELLLGSGCDLDVKGSAGSQPLVPALFAYGMACSSSERTGSQTVSKTPEQREQVRAAQVAHPAASTSAHDPPRPRPCVWPCELAWRRAWSSKANKRKAHEAPWRPRRVHGYR